MGDILPSTPQQGTPLTICSAQRIKVRGATIVCTYFSFSWRLYGCRNLLTVHAAQWELPSLNKPYAKLSLLFSLVVCWFFINTLWAVLLMDYRLYILLTDSNLRIFLHRFSVEYFRGQTLISRFLLTISWLVIFCWHNLGVAVVQGRVSGWFKHSASVWVQSHNSLSLCWPCVPFVMDVCCVL